jgi:hypothetical protein
MTVVIDTSRWGAVLVTPSRVSPAGAATYRERNAQETDKESDRRGRHGNPSSQSLAGNASKSISSLHWSASSLSGY